MLLRFLIICAFPFGYSISQDLGQKHETILCKIKHDTSNDFKDIPGVVPIAIVKNQTLTVTVDVAGKTDGRVFFKACEFDVLKRKSGKTCQELTLVYGNGTYPSHSLTTTGQHLISLNLPDHLRSNQYDLQLTFMKDDKSSSDLDRGFGTNGTLTDCGVFAVKNHKMKRQAETCRGAGEFIVLPGIDEWCRLNCAVGYCPLTHCTCDNQAYPGGEDEEDYEYGDNVRFEFQNV